MTYSKQQRKSTENPTLLPDPFFCPRAWGTMRGTGGRRQGSNGSGAFRPSSYPAGLFRASVSPTPVAWGENTSELLQVHRGLAIPDGSSVLPTTSANNASITLSSGKFSHQAMCCLPGPCPTPRASSDLALPALANRGHACSPYHSSLLTLSTRWPQATGTEDRALPGPEACPKPP